MAASAALTRAHFRELPLKFIAIAALDAPILVYPFAAEAEAHIAQMRLEETVERYRRTFEVHRRRQLARYIRAKWAMLVNQSCGYRWWYMRRGELIEFAPDAPRRAA